MRHSASRTTIAKTLTFMPTLVIGLVSLVGTFLCLPEHPAWGQAKRYDYDARGRRRRPPYRPGGYDRRRPSPGKGPGIGSQPTAGAPATQQLLAGEHEFNECKKIPGRKRVKVTLKPDSELHDLIAWISGMTCKRFIVGSNIRAQKVTIYSPTPVRASEAYRAFLSALNVMNLTVQPAGRYLKVVEMRQKGIKYLCPPGRGCPNDDRIVTRMIRLRHVSPNDVKTVLEALKSPDGNIITYDPTNLIIVTDLGRIIAHLSRIVRILDVESQGERIWVVRLKHADASELATKLQEVFDTGGKGQQQRQVRRPVRRHVRGKPAYTSVAVTTGGGGVEVSKIIPEERTNVLIIVADEKAYLKVRALIRILDIPVKGGEEKIHVLALANANAEDMRDTLSGLTAGGGYRGRTAGRGRTPQRGRTGRTGRSGGSVGLFEGDVQITADKGTNSLVIVASVKDFMNLKKVVQRLDIPRRQVFVEATILEVSLSKTLDLGLAFHGGKDIGSGDNRSLLLFGNNAAKSITLDPASLMGLAIGLRGPELKDAESLLGIPGISFPTFGAFFQALQSDNDVNVVSQPHILTTDNEEAIIEVGENLPFQAGISGMPNLGGIPGLTGTTGTTTGSGYGGYGYFPMTSIQRQDVTLKLKIIPHVNESNFVRLEIEQEINEVKSIDPIVGPTTTKKKIKTVIVVRDQQTAVLGGLITEKTKKNVTKIPLLGDIPILGYLFKSTKTIKEKTNLLLFLTPYIIRDQGDLRRIFRRKLQQRKEFLERYTTFKDHDLDAVIDYRYKRGLVAEIHRVASDAEEEARLKKKAIEESKEVEVGPVVVTDPRDRAAIEAAYRKVREAGDKLKRKKQEEEKKKGPASPAGVGPAAPARPGGTGPPKGEAGQKEKGKKARKGARK